MSVAILLDPGHGGYDSGAVGPSGLKESDTVLKISKILGPLLEKLPAAISYTRVDDTYPSLNARCNQANNEDVDYFISIHCNSNGPSAVGIETLVYKTGSVAYRLAECIQPAMVEATLDEDRGIKIRPDLAVLRGTKMPAVLLETGFISNPATEENFKEDSYLEFLAEAIKKGVADFLGIPPKEQIKPLA